MHSPIIQSPTKLLTRIKIAERKVAKSTTPRFNYWVLVWLSLLIAINPLGSIRSLAQSQSPWTNLQTPSISSLRGLAPVDQNTAWVCGSHSALFRTIDQGKSWTSHPIVELKNLTPTSPPVELRSIHAFSAERVIVATAGTPCRIYRTDDAGTTWNCVFEHPAKEAFIDGLRFYNSQQGIAFGDPVDGKVMVLRSDDQGQSWKQIQLESLSVRDGEAGFAASNSSLMLFKSPKAPSPKAPSANGPTTNPAKAELSLWIGLGGKVGSAPMLSSEENLASFKLTSVEPIPSHSSAGIFSLARTPNGKVIAVGGDYKTPESPTGNIAIFDPDIQDWRSPTGEPPRGFRSCVVYLEQAITREMNPIGNASPESPSKIHWITVGPTGSEWSYDAEHWYPLSKDPYHAVQVAPDGSIWACGSMGRVAVFNSN